MHSPAFMRLQSANPQAIDSAQKFAASGYTLQAICQHTGLGIQMVNEALADEIPASQEESVRASKSGHVFEGLSRRLTYADLRTALQARREHRLTTLSDSTSALRSALVSKALQQIEGGYVTTFKDVMSALRVVGVPTAGTVLESPAMAGSAFAQNRATPIQFILDEAGRMMVNPEYTAFVNKSAGDMQVAPVIINIDAATLARAGTAGGRSVLQHDDQGTVVGLTSSDGLSASLVSMDSDVIHKMAYGSEAAITSAKPKADLGDIIDDL